jgi:hypothetical protein
MDMQCAEYQNRKEALAGIFNEKGVTNEWPVTGCHCPCFTLACSKDEVP